jgi:hypothetical protein
LEVRNQTARYLDNMTLASVHSQDPVNDREVFSLKLIDGDGI